MNFTPLDNKGLVEGFCLIKSIDRKTSTKGDEYLDIMLGDNIAGRKEFITAHGAEYVAAADF